MHLAAFNADVLYNTDEGTLGYETGLSYSRFFPVFDVGFSEARRLNYPSYTDEFLQRTVTAGFHIPLNLSRGYYRTTQHRRSGEHIGVGSGSLVQQISSRRPAVRLRMWVSG